MATRAQIIPVLLLAILVDNRRSGLSVLDRPARRSSRAEAWASLRSYLALWIAILGGASALWSMEDGPRWARTAVYGSVALLAAILIAPHVLLNAYLILQRFRAKTAWLVIVVVGALVTLVLFWHPSTSPFPTSLPLRAVATLLWAVPTVLYVLAFSRRRNLPAWNRWDEDRWREDRPAASPPAQRPDPRVAGHRRLRHAARARGGVRPL
jgi:hypothetical protein